MGVGRLLCNLFLGPFLIYAILMSHVVYNTFLKVPDGGAKELKARPDLKEQRATLVKDFLAAVEGKGIREFAAKYLVKDFQLEDSFFRLNNAKDAVDVWELKYSVLSSLKTKVLNEQHGPNEIILRILVSGELTGGWKLENCDRVIHLLLEKPSKGGGPEKMFRSSVEVNGNPLLTERTVVPSLLGKVHSKLRVFHGYLATLLVPAFGPK